MVLAMALPASVAYKQILLILAQREGMVVLESQVLASLLWLSSMLVAVGVPQVMIM